LRLGFTEHGQVFAQIKLYIQNNVARVNIQNMMISHNVCIAPTRRVKHLSNFIVVDDY